MSRFAIFCCSLLMTGCSAGLFSSDPPAGRTSEEAAVSVLRGESEAALPADEPEQDTLAQTAARASVPFEESGESAIPPEEAAEIDAAAQQALEEDLALLHANPVFPAEEKDVEVQIPEEVVFDFPVVENDRVKYFLELYSGPARRTFARWLERSGRYMPMMRETFARHGLPRDLAYLALVESGFNAHAYSWAHAAGPWQFIESTGRMYGLENDWWRDERRDPVKATDAAARFLSDLHRDFDGEWYLAVAGYNAGPGKIRGAIRRYDTRDFWRLSRGPYLQDETKHYVPKLLAALLIAKEPEKYGFDSLQYHEPLDYETVVIPSATDLDLVARLCGVDYETIKELNPELKRWCTPPDVKNYTLRIPAGTGDAFAREYAKIPAAERARYKHHRIASGDTLLKLAKKYRIRVEDIMSLNRISNPRALQIGDDLILPLKKGYTSLPLDELQDDYTRTRRRTYTVRSGDSLWKIAQRFGVTEKQLRVWNKLGWSNLIQPGQVLAVSSRGSAGSSSGSGKKVVYRVKPGDTLWEIGRRYDVATRQIMNWNDLGDDHVLRPGDKLTLILKDGSRS